MDRIGAVQSEPGHTVTAVGAGGLTQNRRTAPLFSKRPVSLRTSALRYRNDCLSYLSDVPARSAHRALPVWVKTELLAISDHVCFPTTPTPRLGPLVPRQRTCGDCIGMSVSCQKRTLEARPSQRFTRQERGQDRVNNDDRPQKNAGQTSYETEIGQI